MHVPNLTRVLYLLLQEAFHRNSLDTRAYTEQNAALRVSKVHGKVAQRPIVSLNVLSACALAFANSLVLRQERTATLVSHQQAHPPTDPLTLVSCSSVRSLRILNYPPYLLYFLCFSLCCRTKANLLSTSQGPFHTRGTLFSNHPRSSFGPVQQAQSLAYLHSPTGVSGGTHTTERKRKKIKQRDRLDRQCCHTEGFAFGSSDLPYAIERSTNGFRSPGNPVLSVLQSVHAYICATRWTVP